MWRQRNSSSALTAIISAHLGWLSSAMVSAQGRPTQRRQSKAAQSLRDNDTSCTTPASSSNKAMSALTPINCAKARGDSGGICINLKSSSAQASAWLVSAQRPLGIDGRNVPSSNVRLRQKPGARRLTHVNGPAPMAGERGVFGANALVEPHRAKPGRPRCWRNQHPTARPNRASAPTQAPRP